MKQKGLRLGLAPKICLMIIIINLSVAGFISYSNYQNYREAFFSLHADNAAKISKSIDTCISDEEWSLMWQVMNQYLNEETTDEDVERFASTSGYQNIQERIQKIVDSMRLTGVSIFLPETEAMGDYPEEGFDPIESPGMFFYMDFYPSDSESEAYSFGDYDSWWMTYEDMMNYHLIFKEIQESGEDAPYFETLTNGKEYLTDYYPVIRNGNLLAVIMVSGDAIEMEDFIQSLLKKTLIISLIITVVMILIVLICFYFGLIRPLNVIRTESERFIENNTEISQRLSEIKTRDEIQDLAESFLQMEKDVKKYVGQVTKVTAEKERISTELNVANKIQNDMLPTIFPPFPNRSEFTVYATMNPAKEVGGDFYDFFLIDEEHLALVVADVAGKGVPASLFMAISKSLIKSRTLLGGRPAEILYDVNNQLCDGNEEGMFVTVWLSILDLKTGKGIAANAGHEHPVHKEAGGEYKLLRYRHSPAVAAMEGIPFKEHEYQLMPGDRLFVYTDGIPEAINPQKEEYGTDRLVQVLNHNSDAEPEVLLEKVSEDVSKFAGSEPQFDDQTMLIFEYHGNK